MESGVSVRVEKDCGEKKGYISPFFFFFFYTSFDSSPEREGREGKGTEWKRIGGKGREGKEEV